MLNFCGPCKKIITQAKSYLHSLIQKLRNGIFNQFSFLLDDRFSFSSIRKVPHSLDKVFRRSGAGLFRVFEKIKVFLARLPFASVFSYLTSRMLCLMRSHVAQDAMLLE